MADDLGEGDVISQEPLTQGQVPRPGLVTVVGDRAHLVPQASHLPYHQPCHRGLHSGCCLASRAESPQVHRQEHFRPEGLRLYLAELLVRFSLQRCILQEGWRVDRLNAGSTTVMS